MPEYIKRVGEDSGKDLRKALAERLRSQQSEPMPEIRTHWQGIAEALTKGIYGIQERALENKIEQSDLRARERQTSENQAMMKMLFPQNDNADYSQDKIESGDLNQELKTAAPDMGNFMQGKPANNMSSLSPNAQNILIDRQLKDQDMSRKERFKHNEGELNRGHQMQMAMNKHQMGINAHKANKELDSQEKKIGTWEEEGEAARASIQQIDDIIKAIPAAKPGVAFDSRKYLLNAAQSLGLDISKVNLGDPAAMLTIQKGLGQLVINMAKEFGSRILKVEVEAVEKALPNTSTSPEALTKVLSSIRNIKRYGAARPAMANAWVQKYGSLRTTNDAGKPFIDAYDSYAKHKFFSPEEGE